MKDIRVAPRPWIVVLCSAVALFATGALADPPDRVARLTQIQGTVSFSPAGEEDWAIAEANRPVTTGDRVWSDADSHVELQMGDSTARLGTNTAVTVLNLDDRIGQFQLAQGALNVRVRQIGSDQFYEIDTPTLAFSIRRAGDYRIDVDPSGNTTVIQVRAGQGDAWGEGTAYTIDAGQQYTFVGEGLRHYRYDPIPPSDAFDNWCFDRNRREDAAMASSRYVSRQVVGYSDLDQYGAWRNVENYGTVWVPTQVSADWVPYHYGRWAWVEPWGWTWVDDQPWGFAPFHYGRWAYLSNHWCWVPGPVAARPVYSPALVAFVGGGGFSITVGGGPVTGVAWFPLGYGEVYRPAYSVSQTYFTNINVTNTVINTTYVTNVYNNRNVDIRYRYREVPNAVTAVPVNAFASGERVEGHAVRVQPEMVARAPVSAVAAVSPTRTAVFTAAAVAGGAAAVAVASHRPPRAALERQVVARTEPPPSKPSFAQRSTLLTQQPGRPPEADKLRTIRAERPAEAPRVKVVQPSAQPRPIEAARGGPQGGPTAQQERATKERQGRPAAPGPQANVPQPPAAAQERFRGGPQGPTAQEERRRGRPEAAGPQANVAQPPAGAQDRFKGSQGPQAAAPERAQQGRAQERVQQGGAQERAQQERAQSQAQQRTQQERAQQERNQQQERARQERAQQDQRSQAQQQQQRAQQERDQAQAQQRAQQERAQQERAQQERNQQQERARQERAQQDQRSQAQQQQQRAQQERGQAQAQQRAQQERAQQQQAQQQRAQQERAQAQQRAQQQQAQQQQERAQAQAQQRAQQQQAQQQQRAQAQQAQQQRAQQQQRDKAKEGREAQQEKEKQPPG